jgi:WD40 repeat protein
MRQAFAEWLRFLRADGRILRENAALLFQQAANQPASAAPARAALERLASGPAPLPWFRWVNKPQHPDPCLFTVGFRRDAAATFSPDGRTLAVATDLELQLWDVESGAMRRAALLPSGVADGRYTPDGGAILLAGSQHLVVRDAQHLGEIQRIATRAPARWILAPDCRHAACVGGGEARIRMHDVSTGRLVGEWGLPIDRREPAAFTRDGSRVVIHGDSGLVLCDVPSGRTVARLSGDVYSLEDGAVISASRSGEAILHDAADGRPLRAVRVDRPVSRCWLLPGRSRALLQVRDGGDLREHHAIELYDLAAGASLARLTRAAIEPAALYLEQQTGTVDPSSVLGVAPWPDGSHVAVWPPCSREVAVFETTTGARTHLLTRHPHWVDACAVSPDGARLVAICRSGALVAWDLERDVRTRLLGHGGRVTRACPSSDGVHLATTGQDGTIRLWRYRADADPIDASAHDGQVTACVPMPDGRGILSGAVDGVLKRWSADSGAVVGDETPYGPPILAAAASPVGIGAVCVSRDPWTEVHLRDLSAGLDRGRFSLPGHAERGARCRFTPDGSQLVVVGGCRHGIAAMTGTVSIFRVRPPLELFSREYGAAVDAVDVSADSRWIFIRLVDGTLLQWDVAREAMSQQAGIAAFAVLRGINGLLCTLTDGSMDCRVLEPPMRLPIAPGRRDTVFWLSSRPTGCTSPHRPVRSGNCGPSRRACT